MKIIGFSALLGGGKDTMSNLVFSRWSKLEPTIILAFADSLKIEVITRDLIPFHNVYIPQGGVERSAEVRRILQLRGTEQGRQRFGENIWVETMAAWIKVHQMRGIKRFIISDVRFSNEIEWIRQQGGHVIRLHAPNRVWSRAMKEAGQNEEIARRLLEHPSEANYHDCEHLWDLILQNDFGQEKQVADDLFHFLSVFELDLDFVNSA